MYQRNFLVLLVVTIGVFIAESTFATSIAGNTKVTGMEGDAPDPEAEQRGLKWTSFNGIQKFISKPSNIDTTVQNSPGIAKAINNPRFRQISMELGKQPGLLQKFKNMPILKNLATRLRGSSTQITTRQVTNIGYVAVKSRSSSVLTNLWISIIDFFNLIVSFNYPKEHISVLLFTSSIEEFEKVKKLFKSYIQQFPRLSVIFRNDFVQNRLTRGNRHEVKPQAK
ncbi:Secreted RxLR effector peptide protein [Phytophthora palmivora]|uniref:Secreted RxLR effector peptide protein n=1 Tax=Phytophthora palmivora TaxID=4796 RepID=A0A2P4X1G1_9STRA|nr:Secreted RxLR effector peptide protein [Phytophthora palmivora]